MAGLQEFPIPLKFRPMNLGPRFDETLLGPRQVATYALDGVNREHRCRILIVGVKVRSVVWYADLNEHSNDDSEKSGDLRHS